MKKIFCPHHNQDIFIIKEDEILLLNSVPESNCVMLETSDFLIPFRFTEGICDLSCPKVIELQGTSQNDS